MASVWQKTQACHHGQDNLVPKASKVMAIFLAPESYTGMLN